MDRTAFYRLIGLCILWSFTSSLWAQTETFPQDPDGFIQTFTRNLKDTKREELIAAADRLQKLYTEGTLSAGMVGDMILPASLMVERRMSRNLSIAICSGSCWYSRL